MTNFETEPVGKNRLAHWLMFNGRALLSRVLIVGGIVRIWEHRGAQLKFESLSIYLFCVATDGTTGFCNRDKIHDRFPF